MLPLTPYAIAFHRRSRVFIALASAFLMLPSSAVSGVELLTSRTIISKENGAVTERTLWSTDSNGTTCSTALSWTPSYLRFQFNDGNYPAAYTAWDERLGIYEEEDFHQVLRLALKNSELLQTSVTFEFLSFPWSEVESWWSELSEGLRQEMLASPGKAQFGRAEAGMTRRFEKVAGQSHAAARLNLVLNEFGLEVHHIHVARDILTFGANEGRIWKKIATQSLLGLRHADDLVVVIKPLHRTKNK